MEIFYFGTVHAAAIIFFLCSSLLFLRRGTGERSRLMLSGILFLSVLSYAIRYVSTFYDLAPFSITTPQVFLMGIFVVTTYVLYPIEVMAPGWITLKRLLKVYAPWGVLCGVYWVTLLCGVEYQNYRSMQEMLPDIGQFDVWFRVVLCASIYLPAVALFFVHYTRKYSNTNRTWIRQYMAFVLLNSTAYVVMIFFNTIYFHLFYYYCTIVATLYFTYQELYVRLISKLTEGGLAVSAAPVAVSAIESPEEDLTEEEPHRLLRERLERLMNEQKLWQDPDLTIVSLSSILGTNRTTLALLIKEMGYDSYPSFINRRRIAELLKIIDKKGIVKMEDAFFEVGFRSRVNGLRYFRLITNTTPSEYLRQVVNDKKQSE